MRVDDIICIDARSTSAMSEVAPQPPSVLMYSVTANLKITWSSVGIASVRLHWTK